MHEEGAGTASCSRPYLIELTGHAQRALTWKRDYAPRTVREKQHIIMVSMLRFTGNISV